MKIKLLHCITAAPVKGLSSQSVQIDAIALQL